MQGLDCNEEGVAVDEPELFWDLKILLGTGSFGAVYKGSFNRVDVAVKVLYQTDVDPDFESKEATAMQQLDHPNVLKLYHVTSKENKSIFVLELCLATVADYCNDNYGGPLPPQPESLMQMASGVAYIHSKNFVHRDIKPGNVLISSAGQLKISDFGFCKSVSPTGSFSTNSGPKGTRQYYAPEWLLLEESSPEERKHIRANVTIDIFALGCTFFKFLTKGRHPFANPASKSPLYIPTNILDGKCYIDAYPEMTRRHFAFAIIAGMIRAIPEDRWSLDQVIDALKPHLSTR